MHLFGLAAYTRRGLFELLLVGVRESSGGKDGGKLLISARRMQGGKKPLLGGEAA